MKYARSALLLIIISLSSLDAARAQSAGPPDPQGGPPPLAAPPDRAQPPGLGKQILGGVAYGAGGMLAGGAAGAGLLAAGCAVWGEDCGFAGIGGGFLGGVLGFTGAFPYGIYKFGTDGDYPASLGWTYASALLGGAVGFGGSALITRLQDEDARFQSVLIGMAGAPIGALIGFNLTRGRRNGVPQVSLAPMPEGGWVGQLKWSFK